MTEEPASLRLACSAPGRPEIFRSIQGEGRTQGRLRTFVRLSGCNLRCTWCDTPYTWNWRGTRWPHARDRPGAPHKFDPAVEVVELDVDRIAAEVAALPAEGVVITGGEPLLQAEALADLIRRLRTDRPDLLVEIETNGTIEPGAELLDLVDLFMVSPKLGNSGNRPAAALRPHALAAFAASDKAWFKFVAQRPEDIAEVEQLARRFAIAPSRVSIMPEGTTSATVIATGASLIDAVLAAGFNYSDRLHIHLFGDRRGT